VSGFGARLARVGALLLACVFLADSAWAHDSGFGLARYAADGALDRSFGSGGLVVARSTERSFVANALALQSDGRIVVGGMSSDVASGTLQLALARYGTDGSPDDSFGNQGAVRTPVGQAGAEANAIALQPDGRIVVVGTAFAHGSGDDQLFVARYTSAGVLDADFGTAGVTTTHVGAAASAASALALERDGHILVVGTAFSNGPTDDDFAVVRYTFDGQLDQTFGTGGIVTTDFGATGADAHASLDRAAAVTLQPDQKIIVAGFTRGDHQAFAAARYAPDGSLDSSFGSAGKAEISGAEPQVFSIALQPSGAIILAGSADTSAGSASFALVRLSPDGKADEAFGTHGLVTTTVEGSRSGARAVVGQPDGKLVTAGAKFGAPSAQGEALPQSGFALARYNADGSLDTTFGNGGKATFSTTSGLFVNPKAVAVDGSGRLLVAGTNFYRSAVVLRLNADGSADTSFGSGGTVTFRFSPFSDDLDASGLAVGSGRSESRGGTRAAGFGREVASGIPAQRAASTSSGQEGTLPPHGTVRWMPVAFYWKPG